MTKVAPHTDPKSTALGKLTFDGRIVVHRAVPEGNELVGNLVKVSMFDALVVLVLVGVEFAAMRKVFSRRTRPIVGPYGMACAPTGHSKAACAR